MLAKRTYWMNTKDLSKVEILADQKGVSQSDIIRMAIKEYIKRHNES
jgi:metal-responsive CopG/Arc/MetJ family transcriptional regulator